MSMEAQSTVSAPVAPAVQPSGEQQAQSQTPPTEAPTAPKLEANQDLEWVQKFNELKRQERMLHQEKVKAKQEREAFLKREAEWKAQEAKKKENPIEWLQAQGLSYDEITNFILNNGQATPEQRIAALESTIEMERKERAAQKEAEEKARQAAEESQVIGGFKENIKSLISSNLDEFEACSMDPDRTADQVHDIMWEYYQNTQQMLDPKAVLKEVEAELEQEIQKVAQLKKLSKYYQIPQPAVPTESGAKANDKPGSGLSTLTHSAVTSAGMTSSEIDYIADEQESLRRSAEILRKSWAGV